MNCSEKPEIAVRMNNVVVQRILRIQMNEKRKDKSVDMLYRKENLYAHSSTPSKTSSHQSVSTYYSAIPYTNSVQNNNSPTKTVTRFYVDATRFTKSRFQLTTNYDKHNKYNGIIIKWQMKKFKIIWNKFINLGKHI